MSWIDSRLRGVENRIEYLFRRHQETEIAAKAALQNAKGLYQQPTGNTNTGGATVFFANGLTLAAASGTWPTITPSSTSATVYRVVSGALSSMGSKTIYNFMPDATDNTKRQILGSNGDDTYSVIVESCT